MANNKDVKRGIVMYLDGKAVEASASAIQKEMRKVKNEIDKCTIGSKEYVDATKRYKELNAILQEHKSNLKEVKQEQADLIDKANNLWSKWQVGITAVAAALTAAGLALSKFRKQMNEKESAQANLKALTGLDDESISWLTKQAEVLSTEMDKTGLRIKKSANEILEAYMLVGSAKPELLSDKEALNGVTIEALRLAEAAGMNMKDAVDGVTLALNQYGDSADQAARYVNVLAAGSKFGAAGVEAQTKTIVKAGVAANVAKVPIESLVGSIETLAEKGIKGEVAGTGLKTFFLKLEGMADEVRPSVVGLEAALENLRKKNLSTAETQKMFGLEAYTVAQTMISGADAVKKYTSAVTDTNTAIEQAAINSDTAEARQEQMKNKFNEQGQVLVKELNPAITKLISLSMNSTRMLVELIRVITNYKATIGLTTTAIILYVTWTNRKIIADKLSIFWTDKAKGALLSLYNTIKANPYGILLVGVTAVTAALIEHNRRLGDTQTKLSKVEELNKKANDDYEKQKSKIEYLTSVIEDNNFSLGSRKKAIEELKEIVPGYMAELDKEGKLINNNKKALDDYLLSLEKEIKAQVFRQAIVDETFKKLHAQAELTDLVNKKGTGEVSNFNEEMAGVGYRQYLTNRTARAFKGVMSTIGVYKWGEEENNIDDKIGDAARRLENANKNIEKLKEEQQRWEEMYGELFSVEGSGDGGSGSGAGNAAVKEDDRIKKETAAIELEMENRRNALKQQYVEGVLDKEQYNQELIDLEIDRINKILSIAGLEPAKVAELQGKLKDIAIKAKEEMDDITESSSDTAPMRAYQNSLAKIEGNLRKRIAILKRNLKLGIITQEEYAEKSSIVWTQYEADQKIAHQKLADSLRDSNDKQDEEYEDHLKKMEEKARKFADIGQQIGEAIGESVASAIDGSSGQLREAFKSMLNIMLDAIEKMVVAATAQRTIANVAEMGAWGLAKAAGEIALITAAFETAKGVIKNWGNDKKYDKGGYTGAGAWNEPKGIVHANEFVANRYALANPAVKEVLDLINENQQRGTIANLTSDDIRAVGGQAYDKGGYTSANSPSAQLIERDRSDVTALIRECNRTMRNLKKRLDEPIIAETYVVGKGGIEDATRKANQIKRNAGRRMNG